MLREIISQDIEKELEQVGFDKTYRHKASDKFRYKNIKIYNLSLAQTNILKQTAIASGTDCAVHKNVITGDIDTSNVILCGSYSHIIKTAQKLQGQPFNLPILGKELVNFLESNQRKTKLVGILNITPDSFSDGGQYYSPNDAINHLTDLITDGADIIDIGAESTRQNSTPVDTEEQIERLKPVLDFYQKDNIKIPISIDTRSAEVAEYCLNNGASIINDISGLEYDSELVKTVSKYNAGIIIQHFAETPNYNNLMEEIYISLHKKIQYAQENGIKNIIVDPGIGIGFGKTKEHDFEILDRFEEFYSLNRPLMIGLSRKSLLGINNNDNDLKDSLSLALSYPLIKKNIDYLRVHNIKLHKYLLNMNNN